MDKDKALDLARKLGKMTTDNGCSEAEAMLAAERLAKIANEHGLNRRDYTDEQVKSRVKSEWFMPNMDRRANPPKYVYWLVSRVSQAFQVDVVFVGTGGLDVFGDETNVVLFKFFIEEMLEIMPKLRWKAKCEAGAGGQNRSWKESWERGFIQAIGLRMDKILSGLADARSRAIILVTKDQVSLEIKKKYPELRQIETKCAPLDRSAYDRGVRDGQNTKLQEMMK